MLHTCRSRRAQRHPPPSSSWWSTTCACPCCHTSAHGTQMGCCASAVDLESGRATSCTAALNSLHWPLGGFKSAKCWHTTGIMADKTGTTGVLVMALWARITPVPSAAPNGYRAVLGAVLNSCSNVHYAWRQCKVFAVCQSVALMPITQS